ncbi:unnamed protein product [Hymenolepis diminuta]|uniref:Uncharacterized protein n=1 Tax=Hymenolepis diminuta TaxID=6216 RepID=A0A564Z1G3_HYMDI|nr:unnamed protein product [Hymenolepis diminuta]
MRKFDSTERLSLLRREMRSRNLDAFLLPMQDYHFSEYLAAADERVAFISGFTGSAGNAVISANGKAALWTDGRYHNQAFVQLDDNWILMCEGLPDVPTIPSWLAKITPSSSRIGFDPNQVPFVLLQTFQRDLSAASPEPDAARQFVPVEGANLIDLIWSNRPTRPTRPIRAVPVASFAGYSWEAKLDILRERMKAKSATSLVLSQLDEIAWLFNLRGSDISYNPVFFSYAVVTMEEVHLFVDWKRGAISVNFEEYFRSATHPVHIHSYFEFSSWLNSNSAWRSGRIWLPAVSSHSLVSAVSEKRCFFDVSPVSTLKAVKNSHEVEGIRLAILVDSLALCDFLAWLEDVAQNGGMNPRAVVPCNVEGVEPPQCATEASLAMYLDKIRSAAEGCLGLSFSTIPGADANGAVIHYHVDDDNESAPVTASSLFLVDSGGQYETGTTDVTRTVHLGTPTEEQIADYTQVLKAHATLASLIFPDNTPGTKLDVVCRASMWRDRRDYAHGTGHGVGANLCVHEGPIGMSYRRSQAYASLGLLEPGIQKNMVVTIEPGYYVDGKHGIRLENVVLVVDSGQAARDSTTQFLAFDALTLVPFQRRLIDVEALGPEAAAWVDAYHAVVRERLLARLALVEAEHHNMDGNALNPARRRTRDWILRETEALCKLTN